MNNHKGFTLIELVVSMVVLAIVASTGSHFVVSAMESYRLAEQRSDLLKRGRATTEKITRMLRNSVPHSIRISASGRCIEFIPALGGSEYKGDLPVAGDKKSTQTIVTAPFELRREGRYVVVAPYSEKEIYRKPSSPGVIATVEKIKGEEITSFKLKHSHQFLRQSLSHRVYIVDEPYRVCVNTNNELYLYKNYGISIRPLGDHPPNEGILLAHHVMVEDDPAFKWSPSSVNRNAMVSLSLPFAKEKERVLIEHRVHIRNVP